MKEDHHFTSSFLSIIFVCKYFLTHSFLTLNSYTSGFFWFQNVTNYIKFTTTKFLASTLLVLKKRVSSLFAGKSVLPSQFTFLTENLLVSCHFSKKKVFQIIRNPDSNKAHGHGRINIFVLRHCVDLICQFEIIFKMFLRNSRFPLERKRANFDPIHKKAINKLPKTIVRFHFHLFVWKYFKACIMALYLIFFKSIWIQTTRFLHQHFFLVNHELLSAFNMGLEVHEISFDIFKAFNKIWHNGLIFKLRQNGILDEMINILEDFLSDRKQIVALVSICLGLIFRLMYQEDSFWNLCYYQIRQCFIKSY